MTNRLLTPHLTDRGEAANHGVTDVDSWLQCHLPELEAMQREESVQTIGCEKYEDEMVKRVAPAVLASRDACLDAHDTQRRVDGISPLVSKRKVDV